VSDSPARRAAELRQQLDYHNHKYYVDAAPRDLRPGVRPTPGRTQGDRGRPPELVTPDSPTQRVGGKPVDDFRTVAHRVPMLSIDNTYNADELREWDKSVRKALGTDDPVGYVVELKIDGVAMSLTYEDGLLAVGATRGDGERGDDVTHNLRTMPDVPLRLRTDSPPRLFEARGEVYMTRAELIRVNRTLAETNDRRRTEAEAKGPQAAGPGRALRQPPQPDSPAPSS
jgi:DNA ligase (NAD+)